MAVHRSPKPTIGENADDCNDASDQPMPFLRRLLVTICSTAIGRGIVFASGLDRIVADMIRTAMTPGWPEAISWILAGTIGLVGLGLWEFGPRLWHKVVIGGPVEGQPRLRVPAPSTDAPPSPIPKPIAPPAPPATPATPQPIVSKYTQQDANRMLPALHDLHEVIRINSEPTLRQQGFSRAWEQELRSGTRRRSQRN
jgi:hypothetical protein